MCATDPGNWWGARCSAALLRCADIDSVNVCKTGPKRGVVDIGSVNWWRNGENGTNGGV